MFETSMVRSQRTPAAGAGLSLLTLSVAAHSAVVAGVIAASVATVGFPVTAPDQFARVPGFVQVSVPPQRGTTPASPPATGTQPPSTPVPPSEATAPATIPEAVTPATSAAGGGGSGEAGAEAGGPGVPWGVEGGAVVDEEVPPQGTLPGPVEQRVYRVTGEVKAPVLVHRVEPEYPAIMSRNRVPATVVVRCVIDRNGRVRDPEVVVPAMAPFNRAVLEAVRQWRFTPGSLRGEAVEVYLDLTVRFHVN